MALRNITQAKTKKYLKRPYIELDNDKEKIQLELPFPKFIILESIEDTPLTKLSPFLIQKIISTNIGPKTVKILRNGTIMIGTENKKHKLFIKYENFP